MARLNSVFNFKLPDWLAGNRRLDLAEVLGEKMPSFKHQTIIKREVEHLTVELSWKSSELEGNTYSLLETELLLNKNLVAKNKTNFETQMALKHQEAMVFMVDHPQLFKKEVPTAAVEEIYRRLIYNLGIKPGLRRRVVQMTASNYQPIETPSKIKEEQAHSLLLISQQANPLAKALMAFSFIPYCSFSKTAIKELTGC